MQTMGKMAMRSKADDESPTRTAMTIFRTVSRHRTQPADANENPTTTAIAKSNDEFGCRARTIGVTAIAMSPPTSWATATRPGQGIHQFPKYLLAASGT